MAEPPFDPKDDSKDRKVKEDKEDTALYEVPNLLSDLDYDADPQAYAAFSEQTDNLHAVEDLLCDAWSLVGLMLNSVGETGDARDMQVEAGLKVIEEKLNTAHTRIDVHNTHYTNLFLAYCELKAKAGKGPDPAD